MEWRGLGLFILSFIFLTAGNKFSQKKIYRNTEARHRLLCSKCRHEVLGNKRIKSNITFFTSHFSAHKLESNHPHCKYKEISILYFFVYQPFLLRNRVPDKEIEVALMASLACVKNCFNFEFHDNGHAYPFKYKSSARCIDACLIYPAVVYNLHLLCVC